MGPLHVITTITLLSLVARPYLMILTVKIKANGDMYRIKMFQTIVLWIPKRQKWVMAWHYHANLTCFNMVHKRRST